MGTRGGSLSQSRTAAQNGTARISNCSHSAFIFFISALFFEFDQPGDAIVEHRGAERINDKLATLFCHDEIGLFEQIQMMRDAWFADRKTIGDLASGHRSLLEQFKDPAAG